MSIDINWSTLTTGPDGIALAEKVRGFVHEKFQVTLLPPFIKSVKVETFDFGTIAPEIEIKDICDPLPDFYEEIGSDDTDSEEENVGVERLNHRTSQEKDHVENRKYDREKFMNCSKSLPGSQATDSRSVQSPFDVCSSHSASTTGIPGGTSNLNYFHSQLATNLSGSRTPLAAVAGAHLYNGWPECSYPFIKKKNLHAISEGSISPPTSIGPGLREKTSLLTLVSTSNDTRPPTRDGQASGENLKKEQICLSPSPAPRLRKTRVEDIQTMFRVRYSGDVKLSLTAEILLDYPMPCFVGIPIQLRIIGFTFDGVAVLASIRKRVHFCFLSPEDSISSTDDSSEGVKSIDPKISSLLQEIKVESEIGKRESGKQLLKNVGKVEKFVLEQVRRIFEDELVYPSFWTFLI